VRCKTNKHQRLAVKLTKMPVSVMFRLIHKMIEQLNYGSILKKKSGILI